MASGNVQVAENRLHDAISKAASPEGVLVLSGDRSGCWKAHRVGVLRRRRKLMPNEFSMVAHLHDGRCNSRIWSDFLEETLRLQVEGEPVVRNHGRYCRS
jgi:hypothetical protein